MLQKYCMTESPTQGRHKWRPRPSVCPFRTPYIWRPYGGFPSLFTLLQSDVFTPVCIRVLSSPVVSYCILKLRMLQYSCHRQVAKIQRNAQGAPGDRREKRIGWESRASPSLYCGVRGNDVTGQSAGKAPWGDEAESGDLPCVGGQRAAMRKKTRR